MEALFIDYHNYLTSIARKKLAKGNKQWAEDIVQETFYKASINKSKYDSSKGKMITWLTTITVNLCMDFHRKKVNQEIKCDDFSFFEGHAAPKRTEFSFEVRKYLKQLSFNEQCVIRMRYFFKMSAKEMESILGVKAGNIPMIHKRALDKLRDLVEGNEEYGDMPA